ncbi:MAG: cobalt ABC transporter ATP-binding protein [Micrococcales bacterium]|nr:MAG: cobalt ABC transporter ATP-binding protein [Micrococcales bacterium]
MSDRAEESSPAVEQDTPLLSAHDLQVHLPGAGRVLDGTSLRLNTGVRLAVMGVNGAGKSTLFQCLSGALEASGGQVRVDGEPLRHNRSGLRAHRQRVQLVMQDPDDQLFGADVLADVAYGPHNLGLDEPEVDRRVQQALEAMGITELIHRSVHHLSFGQRKRVALAGALAMSPDVLLLDEPTAGLDPQGRAGLLQTLDEITTAGTTIAVTTHDVDLAWSWADEVAVLQDGRIRQSATAQMLCDTNALTQAGLCPPWQVELLLESGVEASAVTGSYPRSCRQVLAVLRDATTRSPSALSGPPPSGA